MSEREDAADRVRAFLIQRDTMRGLDAEDITAANWAVLRTSDLLALTDPAHDDRIRAEALEDAADAIQALHPGEVKASVVFLTDRAAALRAAAGTPTHHTTEEDA